jgi:SAM-dependent methyltransferase
MGEYADLAQCYDLLFPLGAAQRAYLDDLVRREEPRRVLDAGCGTGAVLAHLARKGIEVVGLEPEAEMARRARERLETEGLAGRVITAGIEDAPSVLDGTFQGVTCLGNTLPHLEGPGRLERGFRALLELVAPGGFLLLQMVHFERVIERGWQPFALREIPTPGGDILRFERAYDLGELPRRIWFELRVTGAGLRIAERIPLRPITRADLLALIRGEQAELEFLHGSWQGESRTEDSPATIALIRRR